MRITYKHQADTTRGKEGEVAFVSDTHYIPRIGETVDWPGCEVGMTVAAVEHHHKCTAFNNIVPAGITVWLKK